MIAIRNMEMPKRCLDCPLFDGEYGDCNIIGKTKTDVTEERAENCPLVEIVTCDHCKFNDNNTCTIDGFGVADDYFCAGGKRKE